MSFIDSFVTPSEVVTSMLIDLFETIENSAESNGKSSTDASDINFFIGKCSSYMKHKGIMTIMQGRDVRKGREGYTLLHAAVKVGNNPLIEYMIDNGADINAVDNSQNLKTPIMFAIESRKFESCLTLANRGANIYHDDRNSENIFHYFARVNNSTYLKKIVSITNLSLYDIQTLASKNSIIKKKPFPEYYAPDNSITKDVLISYRKQGSYISINDIKVIKKNNDNGIGIGRHRRTKRNTGTGTGTGTYPNNDAMEYNNTGMSMGMDQLQEHNNDSSIAPPLAPEINNDLVSL